MSKLTDVQIKAWIKAGERFEGRSDGDGLVLCFRPDYKVPRWKLRYRFQGRARVMDLGTYKDLGLAKARAEAKRQRARVTLGEDVAAQKQERKRAAVAAMDAKRRELTVAALADEFYQRECVGHLKHPRLAKGFIDRDLDPKLGKLRVAEVQPHHVDDLLRAIRKRGPSAANHALRWMRRIFDYGVRRRMIAQNPAGAFSLRDAGGAEQARERALSAAEINALFEAMKAQNFDHLNALAVKLLLLLAVRKMELLAARWEEFDLEAGVWALPGTRTKSGKAIDIPLPAYAIDLLRELEQITGGRAYLFPARRANKRGVPHMAENTLNGALDHLNVEIDAFSIHDFRRTARTHLADLGVPGVIAEKVLNHAPKGIEAVYDKHGYFDERAEALTKWAARIEGLDRGGVAEVVALSQRGMRR